MEESVNLPASVRRQFACTEQDVRTYSPLTLAFVGDGIYDILIRTLVVSYGNRAVEKMHKAKSGLVKAQTQAAMAETLLPLLTQEEEAIYKRGRNATTHSCAKNACVADYRKATGFEALCGYLYLTDNMERLIELVKLAMEDLDLTVSF